MRGSSPRVRGRRTSRLRWRWTPRLIPAGAGQTNVTPSVEVDTTAHPRGCGADEVNDLQALAEGGSSPRVRGRRPW